jgi:hypothetical protein
MIFEYWKWFNPFTEAEFNFKTKGLMVAGFYKMEFANRTFFGNRRGVSGRLFFLVLLQIMVVKMVAQLMQRLRNQHKDHTD